tara:strand:- start:557 stop:766 length:210 start_codon:yes stop_codon:yes gene_type:complete
MGQCYSTTSVIVRKASEGLGNAAAYLQSEADKRYVKISQEENKDKTFIEGEQEIEEIFKDVEDVNDEDI